MYNYVEYKQILFQHNKTIGEVDQSRFFNHLHTTYEILFIIKGSGTIVIEDNTYEYEQNAIFLIPPGKYHVLKTPPQRDYERFVINFSPELLPTSIQPPQAIHKSVGENIRALFYKFDKYADRYPERQLYTLLISFLHELLIILTSDDEIELIQQSDTHPLVKKAISYITENIDKPLELKDIADDLFISQTYLTHIFTKTMNISVMRYVRIKKMYLAREYLRKGYLSTKVAEMLGYKDYPTFYKNYYNIFGTSPSYDKILPF